MKFRAIPTKGSTTSTDAPLSVVATAAPPTVPFALGVARRKEKERLARKYPISPDLTDDEADDAKLAMVDDLADVEDNVGEKWSPNTVLGGIVKGYESLLKKSEKQVSMRLAGLLEALECMRDVLNSYGEIPFPLSQIVNTFSEQVKELKFAIQQTMVDYPDQTLRQLLEQEKDLSEIKQGSKAFNVIWTMRYLSFFQKLVEAVAQTKSGDDDDFRRRCAESYEASLKPHNKGTTQRLVTFSLQYLNYKKVFDVLNAQLKDEENNEYNLQKGVHDGIDFKLVAKKMSDSVTALDEKVKQDLKAVSLDGKNVDKK